MPKRFPVPPFTAKSAAEKVRMAEDAWNSRDAARVSLAYTADSEWRNRGEFVHGRTEIVRLLERKWAWEMEYRLVKELWSSSENRIAVRFVYECRDRDGQWFRSYGNELWEFDGDGLMAVRQASINDVAIEERERRFLWPLGPRPEGHPGLSEMGM